MKTISKQNYVAATLAVLILAGSGLVAAQTAEAGFSFAAYGDARTMIYVPYKADQDAEARHLLAGMFNLVMPQENDTEESNQNPACHVLEKCCDSWDILKTNSQ